MDEKKPDEGGATPGAGSQELNTEAKRQAAIIEAEKQKLGASKKEGSNDQIATAKALVEELKKQNEIMAGNLKEAQRLTTENILSGTAPAGSELTQDDKVTNEAKRILAGTGYEDKLFPQK